MRYVIQLDSGKFVKTSFKKPTFCDDMDEAEIWVQPGAARAFCEEKLTEGATIIPLDNYVPELVRVKPPTEKVPGKKKAKSKTVEDAAKDAAIEALKAEMEADGG